MPAPSFKYFSEAIGEEINNDLVTIDPSVITEKVRAQLEPSVERVVKASRHDVIQILHNILDVLAENNNRYTNLIEEIRRKLNNLETEDIPLN